ncbi:hypothetical protein P8C59_001199 [Phyllachora maydis]|uniref:Integrase catalytic domain-containing protein n=1 Tax=Phyllachora maydis TaxID=1825666 RepID=A0AAD9HXQ1_9PEZI|nr:hypothetical protein P8C59_001199 [Phyllachora maydis]
MADKAKGKGIAPKRASNPADLGQSSRPLIPIRTLLEDEEDSEDYSEVIEVLKQHIKSYKRVIASQSSDIKTLLLSLNTLKASVKDSISAIKNISSTLASLTNSSNAAAATIGKTSYSPRFDPFSGTMDLDSPLCPPRKEPYLGPAVDNTATSNLDPPIDIGSKEGFKDTITSSIVKELSKKAYTILDDRISNFLENPNISNTYSDSNQAVLLMLLRDSLSSSPRAAISWIYIPSKAFKLLVRQYSRPIESKKEDVYNEFHALTFSTYRKGLSAFNAQFNGYLAKLTMAKIDIDPSLILNQYFKALESKFPSWAYRAAHVANSSNSTPNSNSNPSKKGKNKKKGSYNLAIEEEEEESDFSSNSSSSSDSNTQLAQLLALKGYKKRKDFKGKGLKTSSNKAKYKDNHPRRRPRDPALYNTIAIATTTAATTATTTTSATDSTTAIAATRPSDISFNSPFKGLSSMEIPSNSIRKEDYRPIIEDAIVSEAIEPNKRYNLRNSPAKGTTLEGVGPSLRGKRPCRPVEPLATAQAPYQSPCETREPEPLTSTGDLPCMLREPVIEGNKVEKAISSPTLKEPNIGHIGLRLLKKTSSITKGLPNFDKIKEADFHCSSYDREGDTVKIRPRPYNRNPIVLLPVDRKSRYRWVFNLPNKSGPIVANAIKGFFRGLRNGFGRYPTKFHFDGGTEITDLLTTWLAKRGIKFSTSAPYIYEQNGLVERSVRVILDQGELVDLDLDLEGAVSLDPSNLNTKKPISIEIGPSKLEPYESSSDKPIFAPKPIEVIAPNQPITNEPLNNSDLISEGDKMQLDYYKLLAKTSSYILSFVYKARKRVISKDIARGFIQVEGLDYTVTYASTSIPPTWRILLAIGAVLDWEIEQADFIGAFLNSALREEIYMEIPKGLLDLAASNKAIYKLLLKYGYNPSTPNIMKLSKALYDLGVFYNAKTCHFIVTYIDDCLFIGPNIGYITDLKKRLNKVYAIEDLEPAAYFLGLSRSLNRPTKSHLNAAKNLFKYLKSTKDYSIYFSYNGNTVADLGPKLSNSSNTTTKLSRDFHSKEGPRPLTTTSTTIVDSRNSKGSSRTSIINSSLVPIGFSDSDFAGDWATSKSTYGYLYKLAGRPISWKTKRATTVALFTPEAKTDGLTEAIREV